MPSSKKKDGKWKYVSSPKEKGVFGMTDYAKKKITVNKKLHKIAKKAKNPHKRYGMGRKELTLLNTIVHETMHKNHPKMHEKTVRRRTKQKVTKMGKKQKAKAYSKFR